MATLVLRGTGGIGHRAYSKPRQLFELPPLFKGNGITFHSMPATFAPFRFLRKHGYRSRRLMAPGVLHYCIFGGVPLWLPLCSEAPAA